MTVRFQVAVVGAGPTGLTLANLLGRAGVRTLLLEKNPSTVAEPRAVSIDDESLRILQSVGLAEAVAARCVMGYGSHYHAPSGRCFAVVAPTGQPYGHPRRNAFRQPVLEDQLRRALGRYRNVEAWFGQRLQDFTQSKDAVRLQVADGAGGLREVVCEYLIGCDGASSTVRGSLGFHMRGASFSERWLVVDLENNRNHEPHTKVFSDARRPCITLPGPEQTRRFEFKVLPGEDEAVLVRPASVTRLLAEHGADPAAVITRQAVYAFHARIADGWSSGRAFLAGDAAHLSPPFAGQGMNSGLRDAQNLAWKLAAVVGGRAGPGLLDSYEPERRDHVRQMIDLALLMGAVISPKSRWQAWLVRTAFDLTRALPPAHRYIAEMRYKPRPRFRRGFQVKARFGGGRRLVGRLAPQPHVIDRSGRRLLLDEALGPGFVLLAFGAAPERLFALAGQAVWDRLGARRVAVLPPESLRPHRSPDWYLAEEAFMAGPFSACRDCLLFLRPDRYVAGVFRAADIARGAAALERLLSATWPEPAPSAPIGAAADAGLVHGA